MSNSLLLFRLGARVLALPAPVTRQVLALEALSPLPGSQGALLGLTTAAGRAVPVVDLRSVLGMPEGERPAQMLLLEIEDQTLALPVKDVIGFIEDDQQPGSELLSAETLIGGYSEGQRGQLINPELLLASISQRLAPV